LRHKYDWQLGRGSRVPGLQNVPAFSFTEIADRETPASRVTLPLPEFPSAKLEAALSLSGSNKSLSLASHGQVGTSVVVHKLQCLISSDSATLASNDNRNSVKFVTLKTIVSWLPTAFGMILAHFSFLPLRIFLIASNINALARSTTLLD
jgi:hypothetical protein